ncbi:MAG: YkgJ family cysteine cluster protein [Deltaproteobacteria bacterium]|nr:YkgJ family cysteine cluster protein [Deltaproteobacteria bacterium]
MNEKTPEKHLTSDRYVLAGDTFEFACHRGVACFTRCCHDADMYLYPYDIVRLKQRCGMTSEAFLAAHTVTAFRDNPYFPHVMLKMSNREGRPCPFLHPEGCQVYEDRPYACRAYPLEPAMSGTKSGRVHYSFYVARHSYCLGHREEKAWTAEQWMQDQEMEPYNAVNASWAMVDALLRRNPFGGQGVDSPAMKMVYMAAYNMDTFRRFVFESSFLSRFHVAEKRLEKVGRSETELLLLGFDWILRFLGGQGPLKERTG